MKKLQPVTDRPPDVEVIFVFNGQKKQKIIDGYRPAHLVMPNYLTTGIHHYYEIDYALPDGVATGTITFISPEYYPHCLWVGKKISIQEGNRIVGSAIITKIMNPLLSADNHNL